MLMKAFLAGLITVSGSSVFAAQYGMAGCGLGAMAFKDQPGKIQIVAATLNNLISPQTFAISSGTSNCYEGGSDEVATEVYIENNQTTLEKDIARGSGETLNGLLTMLDCPVDGKVQTELKGRYGYIYQDQNNLKQIKNRLNETLKTQASCNANI